MKRFVPILVLVLGLTSQVLACPACKDSYAGGGQNASVGDAYSISIIVMLSVPLTILTIAIVMIARRLRQHPNSIA
jgi:hypothetical protein